MSCDDCKREYPLDEFCEHDPVIIEASRRAREQQRDSMRAEGKSEQYIDELFALVDSWPPIPRETAREIAQLLARARRPQTR